MKKDSLIGECLWNMCVGKWMRDPVRFWRQFISDHSNKKETSSFDLRERERERRERKLSVPTDDILLVFGFI